MNISPQQTRLKVQSLKKQLEKSKEDLGLLLRKLSNGKAT